MMVPLSLPLIFGFLPPRTGPQSRPTDPWFVFSFRTGP
jgi:hypothetical protein